MSPSSQGRSSFAAKESDASSVILAENANATNVPSDELAPVRRTATWRDAAYHSVTAMVGAGVLGLPSAIAPLGWVGGVLTLFATFWISWYTYFLLVNMHEVPDLDSKDPAQSIRRLDRYQDLTTYVFGRRAGKWSLLPFQLAVLCGIAITYTVLGGSNIVLFANNVSSSGSVGLTKLHGMIIFGALQMLLSMLPSFNELSFVSLLGAVMSAGYCLVATVLSAMHQPEANVSYDAGEGHTPVTHTFAIFNAITTFLFAYGGHNISLEVQATLPSPPSTVKRMIRGVNIAFFFTCASYFGVAISGYRAFGVHVSDDVLESFVEKYRTVVAVANLMVVIHVLAAYQVYTHPVYDMIEVAIRKRTGRALPIPVRCGYRIIYVALLTLVAVLIPFFGSLMGLVGAIGITPTTFLLPCLLWLLHKQPAPWGFVWLLNWFLVGATGVIGVLGTIGSIYTIIQQASTYSTLVG